MNPRLTELYRSCRSKEALASQDLYQASNILMGEEVAKFAQLIIDECSSLADQAEPRQASDLIKKHFLQG